MDNQPAVVNEQTPKDRYSLPLYLLRYPSCGIETLQDEFIPDHLFCGECSAPPYFEHDVPFVFVGYWFPTKDANCEGVNHMNLEYKGRNRHGRIVWIDSDYYDESKPHLGFEMQEWQVPRYRDLVETAENCMGRKLTKDEARTMDWLSGMDQSSCHHIARFIRDAHQNK